MLNKVFSGLDIPYKETKFKKAPSDYIIYKDEKNFGGADLKIFLCDHEVTVELYGEKIESIQKNENIIEKNLRNIGMEYEKEDRTFIEGDQIYLTIFSFKYKEKVKTIKED